MYGTYPTVTEALAAVSFTSDAQLLDGFAKQGYYARKGGQLYKLGWDRCGRRREWQEVV